jgi:hypothetical protein
MKRLRGFTFVIIMLTWIVLTAIGNVSASRNGETQTLETSPLVLAATPTRSIPRGSPTPKPTRLPLSTPTPPQFDGRQRDKSASPSILAPTQTLGAWQLLSFA